MNIFFELLAFILAIFILVVIHESGHFLVARCFGVKILKFSIGFGKSLYSWHSKKGTEYLISAIPLGGYVKMLDSRDTKLSHQEKHFAFDHKPVLQRLLIVLAGPSFNLLFAIIAFILIFTIGFKTPKPIIGEVIPNSIASIAKLRSGDLITQINSTPINDWQKVSLMLFSNIGDQVILPVTTRNISEEKNITHKLDLTNWQLDNLEPDPLKSLGIRPYQPSIPPTIGTIEKHSPADTAKLQENDMIMAVNNYKPKNWQEFVTYIQQYPNTTVNLIIKRQNKILNITADVKWQLTDHWKTVGFLGVKSKKISWPDEMLVHNKYSFFNAFSPAWDQTYTFLKFNAILLGKLINGKISLGVLGGPISVAESAASSLTQGFVIFFGFLAILSTMLAAINFLPIPGLDGGYILLYLIEAVIRKKPSAAVEEWMIHFGVGLLILLAVRATINDIMRLFH